MMTPEEDAWMMSGGPRLGRVAFFADWRWQIRDGHLDLDGLVRLRGLLDPECNVFPDDDETALMRLDVDYALAAQLGCGVSDLPDAEQLPDTAQGIMDLPRVAPPPY